MKLGYCTTIEHLPLLEKAGIEAFETSVTIVQQWSDAQFRENLRRLADSPVSFTTCNSLIGGFSLYEDTDWSKTDEYLARALPRLGELGIRTVVFGSGGYRRVPEGMDRDAARERILLFLRRLSEKIAPYGIRIAVEPLYQKGSNIINTAAEAAEYVRTLDLPNIRLLLDLFHFVQEGELFPSIADYRGMVIHSHLSNPATLGTPRRGDGIDYAGWIRALRSADYEGLMICEARGYPDPYPEMLAFRDALCDLI